MANTDAVWEKFGASDPYYGVLSHEHFRSDKIDANRNEFFRSGEEQIASFIAKCEQRFGPIERGRALDFGCGVGRLTLALAREFKDVVGLDISPSMLKEADRNAAELKQDRVTFALADDSLSNAPGSYDFVLTYIVLQHIPVSRGMRIIRNMLDKVKPGGGFVIHFSLRDFGVVDGALYWMRHNVPGMNALRNIVTRRPLNTMGMQMNDYPLVKVFDMLDTLGITEALSFTQRHEKLLTVGLAGRRPE